MDTLTNNEEGQTVAGGEGELHHRVSQLTAADHNETGTAPNRRSLVDGFRCCCGKENPKDNKAGCTVLVSAKATVLPGSAKWALVRMEMIVDVICDEQTDDTALEFAEIRIGKPPKNRNECVEWKYNSAEPQNEEKTRVVNKNQGWEGGAAVGYKRGSPKGKCLLKCTNRGSGRTKLKNGEQSSVLPISSAITIFG